MNYNVTRTKKEIIAKRLKLLIDYKTLIAIALLIGGYLTSSVLISFFGYVYFLMYVLNVVLSLIIKQKTISLDFIVGEEALIVKYENDQQIYSFGDIKSIKEKKHSIKIKMNGKNRIILKRIEIPYDLEEKHIEFVKELKSKYENYKPQNDIEDDFEKYLITFKLDPRQELIRYMKYSKRISFNIFITIFSGVVALILIGSKPLPSMILLFLIALMWGRYYIVYRKNKSKKPFICSIGKTDDENLEIKGNTFSSIVRIENVKLLNINDNEYVVAVRGAKKVSIGFAKDEILAGDVDNLIEIVGEEFVDLNNGKQPLLPMIFAIISILCIPLVILYDIPLWTYSLVACQVILFVTSFILAIVGLVKKNILKKFVYIAFILDFIIVLFYISVISQM